MLLADAKTAMKFAFLLVVLALFGIAADARVVPRDLSWASRRTTPPPSRLPFPRTLAEAAALGAGHKLPYSNPTTGACQKSEEKVSITGIPGAFCSPKWPQPALPREHALRQHRCGSVRPRRPHAPALLMRAHLPPLRRRVSQGRVVPAHPGPRRLHLRLRPGDFEKDAKDAETHD